ncbi:MAG: ABC transporter permease [Candidatus Bathyarchaeia archaeon]
MEGTLALTSRELKKWYRTPLLIFTTLFQPIIWLLLFGRAMNLSKMITIPPDSLAGLPAAVAAELQRTLEGAVVSLFGTADYFTFMAGGMLVIIIMFTSMFSGMSVVWDRRLGYLNKFLVAPIPRSSIFMSKVLASLTKGAIQSIILLSVAFAGGLKVSSNFGALNLLGIISVLILLGLGLSALFVGIATMITSHETVIAISNLLNLPLMFASSALLPVRQMPAWLQMIAAFNPITYAVDNVRTFILSEFMDPATLMSLTVNFAVLVAYTVLFIVAGALISHRALNR